VYLFSALPLLLSHTLNLMVFVELQFFGVYGGNSADCCAEDGFAPASIVAPLGTVAILCNALIAPLVFHETFRLRDFTGIVFSTIGAVTIVLSANPQEEKVPRPRAAVFCIDRS
jgi:drug/metabolite transporter (DMT)-like permease